MAVDSKNEFVNNLKASQIIKPEKLKELLEKYPTKDVKKFASRLIQDGTLSRWQAKVLYAGRHKLDLGNYILLDRIRRDELGDRFRATHRSLDRPVEIQLLPKTVSENIHLQKSFVGNVGLISELDHPNITHIHDVDREGAQFFLVDEAHDGLPLDQIDITPEGLILCTHQILQALAFAHSHSVIHGEVNVCNIVCVNNSQFKICGMGLSLVRRKLAGLAAATARDDLVALASILDERFAQFSPEKKDEFAWLGKNLSRLKTDPISVYPRVVVATEQTIETWGKTRPAVTHVEQEPQVAAEVDTDAVTADAQVKPDSENIENDPELVHSAPDIEVAASSSATENGADSEGHAGQNDEDQLQPSHKPSPLVLGAIGLVVAGILTLGTLYANGVFSNEKQAVKNNPVVKPGGNDSIKPDINSDEPETDRTKLPEKLSPADITKALAQAHGQDPADVIEQTNSDPDTQVARKPAVVPQLDQQTDPPEQENNDTAAVTPAKTEADAAPTTPVTTPDQPAVTPTAVVTLVAFSLFESVVDLPTSESKDAFQLGELAEQDKVVSLEIISTPNAFANGKGAFGIQSVDDTNWDVLLLNKPGGTGDPIARITAAENELTFTWNNDVGKRSKANSIRNCVLKLTGGNTSKEIILRDAILLDLKLTQEEYTRKIKTNANWLPLAEAIHVEVAKPPAPWPAKLFSAVNTEFPATFTFDESNRPMPMYFSPDSDKQHLSIVLQPVINKSLAFNLGVFAQGKETEIVQYKSYQSAEETVQFLQRAKESKFAEKNQADLNVQKARYGQIGKARDAASAVGKQLSLIKDNLEISGDIRDILKGLHDAPLPVTVYYELDGRRVIIAKTSTE